MGGVIGKVETAFKVEFLALDRKISPTLYTSKEFTDRKAANNPFLTRVLSGEHLVLVGEEHESSAA